MELLWSGRVPDFILRPGGSRSAVRFQLPLEGRPRAPGARSHLAGRLLEPQCSSRLPHARWQHRGGRLGREHPGKAVQDRRLRSLTRPELDPRGVERPARVRPDRLAGLLIRLSRPDRARRIAYSTW